MSSSRDVRMGEFAIAGDAGDCLTVVGIGSCIALILVDARIGTIGVAHVVLPGSNASDTPPSKYATLAVPHLVDELSREGSQLRQLGAVLIGGAQMFKTTSTMEIGRRNTEAVREALAKATVPVLAEEVGGNTGRTARVVVGDQITVQPAGGRPEQVFALAPTLQTPRRLHQTTSNRLSEQFSPIPAVASR